MLFDPSDLSQGPADSVYDSLKDDHEAIEDAGVASGYAPEQNEMQFGEIWVFLISSPCFEKTETSLCHCALCAQTSDLHSRFFFAGPLDCKFIFWAVKVAPKGFGISSIAENGVM